MPDTAPPSHDPALDDAIARDDAFALAELASNERLQRMHSAEQVLALRFERKKRNARIALLGQALVGYVALAGFFANAYQNWNNKKQAEAQAERESERWGKEFRRAQEADKYRAFFETSALATDPTNGDKRLVGYALLKEFVDDKAYTNKAVIMLEESLAFELRGDTVAHGMDDQRRLAVVAILAALSETGDCKVLAQAARSVEKLVPAKGMARRGPTETVKPDRAAKASPPVSDELDLDQIRDVYELYVRRILGRAATVCATEREFREVRRPVSELLLRLPALVGALAKLAPSEAHARIAAMLLDGCRADEGTAAGDCAELKKGYLALCAMMAKHNDVADDAAGCALMR